MKCFSIYNSQKTWDILNSFTLLKFFLFLCCFFLLKHQPLVLQKTNCLHLFNVSARPVHNWTMEDTVQWLKESVELPQYEKNFRDFRVTGNTLPR